MQLQWFFFISCDEKQQTCTEKNCNVSQRHCCVKRSGKLSRRNLVEKIKQKRRLKFEILGFRDHGDLKMKISESKNLVSSSEIPAILAFPLLDFSSTSIFQESRWHLALDATRTSMAVAGCAPGRQQRSDARSPTCKPPRTAFAPSAAQIVVQNWHA